MENNKSEERVTLNIRSEVIGAVFGGLDSNIKKIERAFGVSIINRGDSILIVGDKAQNASKVINKLIAFAEDGSDLSDQSINYLINALEDENYDNVEKINDDKICLTASGRYIKPKTLGQKKYVDNIRKKTIVFGIGPAGTGKTYLAMALAITAFKNEEVGRIILTRPAIEAGEKLGFLPGDLQQKVDPYLRPLYDALYEIMGSEAFLRNMEKGTIEVAPLAYMRGRTLDNAFIVLDEAQNTTPEQMKMFLTRMGFGSKMVITGDVTQIDLPEGKKSGLNEATRILQNIDDIGISVLTNKDVVRHQLVQKIIEAYEKYETPTKKPKPEIKKKRFVSKLRG